MGQLQLSAFTTRSTHPSTFDRSLCPLSVSAQGTSFSYPSDLAVSRPRVVSRIQYVPGAMLITCRILTPVQAIRKVLPI